jgi:hypothetical protein
MPTSDHPVKLTGEDTHRLADMAGVQMDLRSVAAIVYQLKRRYRPDEDRPDFLLLSCMQDAALIRYGRCFRGGVRTAFIIPEDWLAGLDPDLRAAHRDFLDLRDKNIAHSVNDWELNSVVTRVQVDQATGEVLKVHGVSVNQSRTVLVASDTLDRLWRLAKTLADLVEAEMKIEQDRLLHSHAKKIPHEELKRRIREDDADIPGSGTISKARRR